MIDVLRQTDCGICLDIAGILDDLLIARAGRAMGQIIVNQVRGEGLSYEWRGGDTAEVPGLYISDLLKMQADGGLPNFTIKHIDKARDMVTIQRIDWHMEPA